MTEFETFDSLYSKMSENQDPIHHWAIKNRLSINEKALIDGMKPRTKKTYRKWQLKILDKSEKADFNAIMSPSETDQIVIAGRSIK